MYSYVLLITVKKWEVMDSTLSLGEKGRGSSHFSVWILMLQNNIFKRRGERSKNVPESVEKYDFTVVDNPT